MDWRRYLAEVPQAHAKRVRALLPQLLAVGAGAGPAQAGDSAVRFLLPALVQGAGAAEEAPDDDGAGAQRVAGGAAAAAGQDHCASYLPS